MGLASPAAGCTLLAADCVFADAGGTIGGAGSEAVAVSLGAAGLSGPGFSTVLALTG